MEAWTSRSSLDGQHRVWLGEGDVIDEAQAGDMWILDEHECDDHVIVLVLSKARPVKARTNDFLNHVLVLSSNGYGAAEESREYDWRISRSQGWKRL
jgi:hypothetical protein